jgi:hypothetical protein
MASGLNLRYLASSKAFTKLTEVEIAWLKRVSRSAAAASIILCGKHPDIEAESRTGPLNESAMLSSDLIEALVAVRPAILPMCRNRAHQLTPLLQVGRVWYTLCLYRI